MSIAIEDVGEAAPFLEGLLREKGVPRFSRWRFLSPLGFWVIDGQTAVIRWRHNTCSLFPVYIELVCIVLTFFEWYYRVLPAMPHQTLCLSVMLFIWATSVSMFLVAWLSDPGYLPFFYPATERRKFTPTELRYGTATNEVQREWARRQPRPARIAFSEGSGRFIIRGDHYCSFVGNWVGLYNHRYFLLSITYLLLYILFWAFCLCWEIFEKTLVLTYLEILVVLVLGVGFGYLLSVNVAGQLRFVARNRTLVDYLRKRNTSFDRGCLNNYEDVCGPRKYLCLWWLPVPLPRSIDGFGYGPIDPAVLNEGAPGKISEEFVGMPLVPFS